MEKLAGKFLVVFWPDQSSLDAEGALQELLDICGQKPDIGETRVFTSEFSREQILATLLQAQERSFLQPFSEGAEKFIRWLKDNHSEVFERCLFARKMPAEGLFESDLWWFDSSQELVLPS